jgi:hypothetical protein
LKKRIEMDHSDRIVQIIASRLLEKDLVDEVRNGTLDIMRLSHNLRLELLENPAGVSWGEYKNILDFCTKPKPTKTQHSMRFK